MDDMDPTTENIAVGPGSTAVARHRCPFPGCDKSFIRKEHLTRHERSHAPQRSLVCYVCQRSFTRNDILRRHIIRHNSSARATARNGRACDGCHVSKVKCEGGQPCSPCNKRGIECKFERDEVTAVKEALSNSAVTDDVDFPNDIIPPVPKDRQTLEHHRDTLSNLEIQDRLENTINGQIRVVNYDANPFSPELRLPLYSFNELGSFTSPFMQQGFELQESPADTTRNATGFAKEDFLSFENISSFNDKSTPRGVEAWAYPSGSLPLRMIPKSVTKERYDLYLDHFHHRWPIIHIPSFEKDDNPYVLTASVEMTGAWLQGSCESKMIALTLHDRLTNHIFQRMYQKPSYEDRYKQWPISFYQAALLNVIFGLYLGVESFLCRARLLRSMLISNLRDLGFFRLEIAILQERDARFQPYIMSKQEEKKRLAMALFKVDCYFSIIRGEPMTLRCEELHFSLPVTFSLFNAPGLHIWEVRFPDEPVQRSQETVSSMISDLSFSSIIQPFMLVEDIQLGICASQAVIWQYSEKIQSQFEHNINSLIRQKSLRDGLNSWKQVLDQTAIGDSEPVLQGKTNNIPLKYYYGVENHAEAGWQEIVLNRPQSLLFDTAMLYHLFGMHVHANIRNLETLASSERYCRIAIKGDGRSEKFPEDRARHWTKVDCSRQAIWHASNVLALHRSISGQIPAQIRSLDPIAHVAVAVSSLVVWAYCSFNEKGCTRCISSTDLSVEVELMDVLTSNEQSEKWIELGGRAALDGHIFCRCNVERLVQIFQQCLPSGTQKWGLAECLSSVLKTTD